MMAKPNRDNSKKSSNLRREGLRTKVRGKGGSAAGSDRAIELSQPRYRKGKEECASDLKLP